MTEWAPILQKKKKEEKIWTEIQKEDHVKAQGEDEHLQDKEDGPRSRQPCWHLELELLSSRTVR